MRIKVHVLNANKYINWSYPKKKYLMSNILQLTECYLFINKIIIINNRKTYNILLPERCACWCIIHTCFEGVGEKNEAWIQDLLYFTLVLINTQTKLILTTWFFKTILSEDCIVIKFVSDLRQVGGFFRVNSEIKFQTKNIMFVLRWSLNLHYPVIVIVCVCVFQFP